MTPTTLPHAATRLARAEAVAHYRHWQSQRLVLFTDVYRKLTAALALAIRRYRVIQQHPDGYSVQERSYWIRRLGALYDLHALLETDLDLLIDDGNTTTCYAWYEQEGGAHGRG